MTPERMKQRCTILIELLSIIPDEIKSYPILLAMKESLDKALPPNSKDKDVRAISGLLYILLEFSSVFLGKEVIHLSAADIINYTNRMMVYISKFETGDDPVEALKETIEELKTAYSSNNFKEQFSRVLDELMKDPPGSKPDPKRDN